LVTTPFGVECSCAGPDVIQPDTTDKSDHQGDVDATGTDKA